MKKYFFLLMSVVFVTACTHECPVESVTETLSVYGACGQKITINSDFRTVWNKDDCVSVFVDGGENELWRYVGEDNAFSGSITRVGTFRTSSVRKVAVYPFGDTFVQQGMYVKGTFSPDRPMLAAITTGKSLHFSYLTAAVKVKMDREVPVSSIKFEGCSSELVGGAFNVDVSGDNASLAIAPNGSTSLVMDGWTGSEFVVNIPPASFSEGFTITFTYPGGATQTVRYTQPLTFLPGNVLELGCCSEFINPSDVLFLDFRTTCPFGSTFPTSVPAMRIDNAYTFTQDGKDYQFYFHPGYYEYPEDYSNPSLIGTPEYGYRWVVTKNVTPNCHSLLIGRDSSYIKLPAIEGKSLVKFEYLAGNTTTSWFLASTSKGESQVSGRPESAVPGEVSYVDVDYFARKPGVSYYYFQSSGNVVFLWWKLYYQ